MTVFPSNFGTLYQLLLSIFSSLSLSLFECPRQETLRLWDMYWEGSFRRTLKINTPEGAAGWTEQCEKLNCKAAASKPQYPKKSSDKALNFVCLHQPVMDCGLSHGNGLNLIKKASFCQQQILERETILIMKANTPGTWGHITEFTIFSVYNLDPYYNEIHISQRKRGEMTSNFFLSIILFSMLDLPFLVFPFYLLSLTTILSYMLF